MPVITPPSAPSPLALRPSRRDFLRRSGAAAGGVLLATGAGSLLGGCATARGAALPVSDALHAALPAGARPSPAAALARLRAGNARYAAGRSEHPDESRARRDELCAGQEPFAAVLGCVDSRVPPELVFDQGLGDLFVVRSAGHVLSDVELGSLEYGIEELGVPLLVVLAHERCGAVGAAVATAQGRLRPRGHVATIVDAIRPAVAVAQAERPAPGATDDLIDRTVRAHLRSTARTLRAAPALAERIEDGRLLVVAAHYDLETNVVAFEEASIA